MCTRFHYHLSHPLSSSLLLLNTVGLVCSTVSGVVSPFSLLPHCFGNFQLSIRPCRVVQVGHGESITGLPFSLPSAVRSRLPALHTPTSRQCVGVFDAPPAVQPVGVNHSILTRTSITPSPSLTACNAGRKTLCNAYAFVHPAPCRPCVSSGPRGCPSSSYMSKRKLSTHILRKNISSPNKDQWRQARARAWISGTN